MLLMVLGIVFLCQPWSAFLHTYSVAITLDRPDRASTSSPDDRARSQETN